MPKICNLFIFGLQKRTSITSKHEIYSLFLLFLGSFLPSWIRIQVSIPIADPDPGAIKIHADPDPQHCYRHCIKNYPILNIFHWSGLLFPSWRAATCRRTTATGPTGWTSTPGRSTSTGHPTSSPSGRPTRTLSISKGEQKIEHVRIFCYIFFCTSMLFFFSELTE